MDKKAKKDLYSENQARAGNSDEDVIHSDPITRESTLIECYKSYRSFLEDSYKGREMSDSMKKKLEHGEVFISEFPEDPFFPVKLPSYIAERLAQFEAVYGVNAKRNARICLSEVYNYALSKVDEGYKDNPCYFLSKEDRNSSELMLTDDDVKKLRRLSFEQRDSAYFGSLTLLPVADRYVRGLTINDVPLNGNLVVFKYDVTFERIGTGMSKIKIKELGEKSISVEVSGDAISVLRNQRDIQEYRMKNPSFAAHNPYNLLFTTEKGMLLPENRCKDQMSQIKKKMDMPKLRANQLYKITQEYSMNEQIEFIRAH